MKQQDFGYRAAVFAGVHASVFTFSLHIQSTVRFLSWVGIFLMVARDPDLQAQSYVDQGLDASDEGNPALALQYLDQALILDQFMIFWKPNLEQGRGASLTRDGA